MSYYRQKSLHIVKASLYAEGRPIPDGVKFKTLNGVQIAYVVTLQGTEVPVQFGEWIVTERGGDRHYPIENSEFERLYEYLHE